jgi:hypothetical protein
MIDATDDAAMRRFKLSRVPPLTAVRGVCDHADAEAQRDGVQPPEPVRRCGKAH